MSTIPPPRLAEILAKLARLSAKISFVIDLSALRADPQKFYSAVLRKNVEFDVDEVLELDEQHRELIQKVEVLRRTQNEANQRIVSEKDAHRRSTLIAEMKAVAGDLKLSEGKLTRARAVLQKLLLAIPNPPDASVPNGGEDDAKVEREVGKPRQFDFNPRDHTELGKLCDLFDTVRAAKISGARFYFLKNEAVLLEFALIQFVLEMLQKKGFTPMTTPTLVREAAMEGTGFFPAEREQIYAVNSADAENPDGDNLFLVGTSEVPLAMFHADEILEGDFPKRYVGFSSCFRREVGSAGRDTHGIFRVHQFDKLEMFSFAQPKQSAKEHEFLLSCQEEILQALDLPYRVVNIAAGDLGMPAAKKYDCEVWLPSEKRFRELTSCSNCTDFQARRAGIRFRTDGGNALVHTLNGTAVAITRMLIAIFENYQNADGSITIPAPLAEKLGQTKITPREK